VSVWLADTGPLVAVLISGDRFHEWAATCVKDAPATVLTCEAVVSEALFLLKRDGHEADAFFALIEAGFVRVDFSIQNEHKSVRQLMQRYRNRPMSFADACLVRMAEMQRGECCIWTLDRDFSFYRKNRNETLSLVAPW
jgi:predicted nucleic acid-binding protein